MPSESELISEIEKTVAGYLSYWTIGITTDPDRRKLEHGSPVLWHHWDAGYESVARRIEKYFLDKGLKGDTGGGFSPHFVYVFWK
jgi:hypothetical protein